MFSSYYSQHVSYVLEIPLVIAISPIQLPRESGNQIIPDSVLKRYLKELFPTN